MPRQVEWLGSQDKGRVIMVCGRLDNPLQALSQELNSITFWCPYPPVHRSISYQQSLVLKKHPYVRHHGTGSYNDHVREPTQGGQLL
jgi:hypothetical protein